MDRELNYVLQIIALSGTFDLENVVQAALQVEINVDQPDLWE